MRTRIMFTVQEDVFRFVVTEGKGLRQKVYRKSKRNIQVQALLLKSWFLRNNEEKLVQREATDINIIRRMRTENWIPKAINTHTTRMFIYCLFTATIFTKLHYKNIAVIVAY